MKQDIYCNPLPLPEIGLGFPCRAEKADVSGFSSGEVCDFREVADPEMLYHDGVWYMYPSSNQVYYSHDMVHWEHRPIEIEYPLGYAPSAVFFRGSFLVTSSANPCKIPRLFSGATPFGPFKLLGEPSRKDGSPIEQEYLDPSLFADDDGKLYLYWGCAPYGGGIYGMELEPDNPIRGKTDPVKLIDFQSGNSWEHYGEYNEHEHHGWNEGVSMLKHNGVYYLQYACCGTVFRNYAIGCYRSSASPLGPFQQPATMLARQPHGMVAGTGHGGMVHGKNNSVWQFYTCLIHRVHVFERRIGMDRVTFDENGIPHCKITSAPQSLTAGDCGWVPVSVNKPAKASSHWGGNYPVFAVDECTHTWWEPDPADREPALTVCLKEYFTIQALRVIWTEPELNHREGRFPEPVHWKVEFLDQKGTLLPGTLDCSGNTQDLNVDFQILEIPVKAFYVRLLIERKRNRYRHGVTDLTLFACPGGEKE